MPVNEHLLKKEYKTIINEHEIAQLIFVLQETIVHIKVVAN
jgi:hypothetical protein